MLPGQGRGTAHYTAVKGHKIFEEDGRDSETCRCVLGSQVHLRSGEAPSLQQHQDKCRESRINTAAVNLPGCGKEPAPKPARGCRRSKAAAVEESRESSPGKEPTRASSIPASPAAAPLDGGAHPPLPPPASAQSASPRAPSQHPGEPSKKGRTGVAPFLRKIHGIISLAPAINGSR